MLIGVPKEIKDNETRAGLTPAGVRELVTHGHQVIVEPGLGTAIGMDDALYVDAEALDERLDNPSEVLEILVSSAAKGEQAVETWERLHEAATRFDKVGDLALAYEHVTLDKRVKLLQPEQQAFIFLQATQFFTMLGDSEGAAAYAERAIAAVPGHPEAFARLESLLTASGKLSRLAQHYLDASQRETDVERRRGVGDGRHGDPWRRERRVIWVVVAIAAVVVVAAVVALWARRRRSADGVASFRRQIDALSPEARRPVVDEVHRHEQKGDPERGS